jgi:P27 family predicted phage terminase small subunit
MSKMPSPPSFLDATGKRHWKTYGEELLEMGVLTKADLPAFTAYCVVFSTWLESHKDVKTNGTHRMANNGYPIYNPNVGFRDKAIAQLKSFWTEFGMTPSSRTGIKVEPRKKDESDELENLIKFAGE